MKLAEGEAVDRENVTVGFFEPALKFQKGRRLVQFNGRLVAQAQSDGKRLARADFFPDGQRVIFEGIKGFAPRFTAVYVRAIGKVQAVF